MTCSDNYHGRRDNDCQSPHGGRGDNDRASPQQRLSCPMQQSTRQVLKFLKPFFVLLVLSLIFLSKITRRL